MPHDIAMEVLGVASEVIVNEGDTASITFEAVEDDIYYCTIPGHREAGMEGRFEVTDEIIYHVITDMGNYLRKMADISILILKMAV